MDTTYNHSNYESKRYTLEQRLFEALQQVASFEVLFGPNMT
jgi:hypothetical protein